MNEEQQIEEMAKIYCKTEFLCNKGCQTEGCRIYEICDTLYNAGYRKVPEDSVVLSREEYIDLSRNYVGEQVAQAHKETAEKILDLLVPDCKACDENWHSGCLCLRATLVEKIAKQFGVEIKE